VYQGTLPLYHGGVGGDIGGELEFPPLQSSKENPDPVGLSRAHIEAKWECELLSHLIILK
jgi:hypothetical protein